MASDALSYLRRDRLLNVLEELERLASAPPELSRTSTAHARFELARVLTCQPRPGVLLDVDDALRLYLEAVRAEQRSNEDRT